MKNKIIKVITVCCVLITLCINVFAIDVSSNDGGAFITKAEFDTLKSSFQSQIDYFNNSIDSKIDTAIASYLEGIKIANTVPVTNFALSYWITGAKNDQVSSKDVQYWTTNPAYRINANSTQTINYSSTWWMMSPSSENGYYEHVIQMVMANPDDGQNRLCTNGDVVNSINKMRYNIAGTREFDETTRGDMTTLTTGGWEGSIVELLPYDNRNDNTLKFNNTSSSTSYFWWSTSTYTETTLAATVRVDIAPYSVSTEYVDDKGTTTLSATAPKESNQIFGGTRKTGYSSAAFNNWRVDYPCYKWYVNGGFLKAKTFNNLQFNDFKKIDSKNSGKMKEGFVLCNAPKKGKLKIEVEVSRDGWFYVWRNSTSSERWHDRVLGDLRSATTVSNWTSPTELKYQSEFKTSSKKFSKTIDVEKDEVVWFMYLPTPTTISGSAVTHNVGYIKSAETTLEIMD